MRTVPIDQILILSLDTALNVPPAIAIEQNEFVVP